MHNHKNLNNKHVQYCNQYSKYEGGGKSTSIGMNIQKVVRKLPKCKCKRPNKYTEDHDQTILPLMNIHTSTKKTNVLGLFV